METLDALFTWLSSILNFILNIELFPNITLGLLFLTMFSLSFLFKLFLRAVRRV